MEHRPSLPATVGSGLRRQLEQSSALQSVVYSGPALSARRTAARTVRRLAPATADRLISEFKGTEPLLDRVRVAAARTRRRGAALRASAALTVAAVVGGMVAAGPQTALAATPSAGATAGTAKATTTVQSGAVTTPQIYPRPQSQESYGAAVAVPERVAVVAAPQADPGALEQVRAALKAAGVQQIDESTATPTTDPAPGSLTVYVGGLAEGAGGATDRALRGIAASGGTEEPLSPAGLPAGGYVLAVGRQQVAGGTAGAAVLAGVDADGTYNAAQSLRQLFVRTGTGAELPGVRVSDWPTTPVRGTEEGFFGTPWTEQQTLDEVDFLGRTKQNYFLYSPGDDPFRSSRWREEYPADQRQQLRTLGQAASLNHVTLGYGLSLGGSVCFSSAKDQDALIAKLESLWALGFRSFQLQFQDSSFSHWHCDADVARYGRGAAAMARAQSDLAAVVIQRFLSGHPDAAPLMLLPTEYYQDGATPYRTALAKDLDPSVQVAWTGVGVQPTTITGSQTSAAAQAFGHPLVTQDNYLVNDSTPDRLYLGPYAGRDSGVAIGSAALLVNAMQQPVISRIPLFTAADFAWNPTGYDAQASWRAAEQDLASGQPKAAAALAALAGNSASPAENLAPQAAKTGDFQAGGTQAATTPTADQQESAYLRPLISAFWSTLGGNGSAAALRAAFTTMAGAPAALAAGEVPAEDGDWLAQLALYGRAGQTAVDMLTAQRSGAGASAWADQLKLRQLMQQLSQSDATIGSGVLDAFLKRVLVASNSWAGLGASSTVPTSTLGTSQDHDPSLMVDGDPSTYYWSDAPPQVSDTIGVDLGSAQQVGTVSVLMGSGDDGPAAGDYLHDAVLEYSTGDGGWHTVGTYHDQETIRATLPAGTTARYVRLRATATQANAVAVREFTVTAPSDPLTASGGPVGQPGFPVSNVTDGDLNSAYRAVAAPQAGDALTVTLGTARALSRVVVLTDPTVAAKGWIEVHQVAPKTAAKAATPAKGAKAATPAKGTAKGATSAAPATGWVRLGPLSAGYTELAADPRADVDQIRLVWAAGSPPPVVDQVVPWYADTPVATLQLPDQSVDVEAGGDSVDLTGDLQALGFSGASGTLAAELPKGLKGLAVTTSGAVALPRGGTAATAVHITAAAGTPLGSYAVPVVFTPSAGGQKISRTVQVHVYPRTSGPDLAPTATATASGDAGNGFGAGNVNDGDETTRWLSPAEDDAWVQLELPQAATLGAAVLHWPDTFAAQYRIETSTDGVTWTTVATVPNGQGGDETVHFDAPNVRFVRMQGVQRGTRFGYSLFGIELYAVAGTQSTGGSGVPPTGTPSQAPGTGASTQPSASATATPSAGASASGTASAPPSTDPTGTGGATTGASTSASATPDPGAGADG
ncbi:MULTISPECIES: beta-N-acetylglucosaminidase domain-containing protein [Streptacidiphilus]|uniref:Beta-N-acetylglucosaminidase domain-containing protein n=1 Tax=Streptacidiphilus cavernicola TaxID=3342716 RepID=A0ABV6UEV9_9ACTN|nr:beta-N-acetylglucosaminidase domain-containing protein [Streptacidiphilus jeojiense]